MAWRPEVVLSTRHEYRVLGFMLASLHVALWWDFGGVFTRPLILAHLGLFLIWQPIWSRRLRLSWSGAAIFLPAMAAFILWLNWWVMSFWLLLLIGLIGGRITVGRAERYAYLMALLFLVSDLFLGSIPRMFAVTSLGSEVKTLFGYGLLLVPLALVLIPGRSDDEREGQGVDFLYGLTMSMLTAILGMGTLLSMYATGLPYAVALCQAVLVIALFLVAISWLWAPVAGFSGFGQIWERYLLNIGTPVEGWLAELENVAQHTRQPEEFFAAAMGQLVELPWVGGIVWHAPGQQGSVGTTTSHSLRVEAGRLDVTVHAHRPIGPALLLHARLLISLIGHFHRAKEREQELSQRAHMQAVYETGARITHDIKNLLQSLHTMTTAVEQNDDARRDDLERLLRRQLPHLTHRLRLALDKLETPGDAKVARCPVSDWWEALKARNEAQGVRFESHMTSDPVIPAELFDSVADNLLENARVKRQSEPELDIAVTVVTRGEKTTLSVVDSGTPVAPEVRQSLFRAPVKSRNGLGIGLYQAARQAHQMGYTLSLREDLGGPVCFELQSH
jgi:signal transduction histidine kinase